MAVGGLKIAPGTGKWWALGIAFTLALSTVTFPPVTVILTDEPCTVRASLSLTTSAAITFPATTW